MAVSKEELRKVVLAKKRDYTRIILGISCTIFAIFILIAILNGTNQMDLSLKSLTVEDVNEDGVIDEWDANSGHDVDGDGVPDQAESPIRRALNFTFIGLAIMIGPYAFYTSSKYKIISAVEKRLPDFLRDVAEAGRFGMTLADAIVVASSGRYGKLTPEIKKMAAQIEWGVPATEAMRLFANRIDTPLVHRVVSIVVKSSDAGGSVADVLTMVSHDTKELQLSQEERNIEMSTYLAVIYISFFVFLVTIIILNLTFLPKIREAGMAVTKSAVDAGLGSASIGGASLDVSAIPNIELAFFLASMIHAVGDGLMAGVLQNGRISEGLKHSFIMLILGILILTLL